VTGKKEWGKGGTDREDGGPGHEHDLFTHKTEGERRTCVPPKTRFREGGIRERKGGVRGGTRQRGRRPRLRT